MPPSDLTILIGCVSLLSAVVSTGCSVFNLVRTGRRIKSGEAKELSDRIATAQATADGWHESDHAKVMEATINNHTTRIGSIEQRMENVATRTDLAIVEGTIKGVEAIVQDVRGGVDRIESMLMAKALNA